MIKHGEARRTGAEPEASAAAATAFRAPDLAWSLVLIVIAGGVIAYLLAQRGPLAGPYGSATALFFLGFGLFTITMGYPHPNFGHVSFDKVAQVASVLVLGPVDAAWINGLASLLWPWHRLLRGTPLRTVLVASLHNAGLMALVVLAGGALYLYLGGPVPLSALNLAVAGPLLLLVFAMQALNDIGMLLLVHLRRKNPAQFLNIFSSAVELASSLIAVLVAIVFVRLELPVFVLLLVVLGLGMLVLKRFAEMRQRLENLVEKRTEELRLKSKELEQQATHDKLTGLFNRRYADDYLEREIDASHRSGRELTIALADIDYFKSINDSYSHAVGDEVLRRVSRILVKRCRKTDVVARYGGEEFLLCFPETSAEFAAKICGQIRDAVEKADWAALGPEVGEDFGITISFGIAEAGFEARRTSVLNAADRRLYRAKQGGRNRVEA